MAKFESKFGIGDTVTQCPPKRKGNIDSLITGVVESVSFREKSIFYQVRFLRVGDNSIHIWPFEEGELQHKGSE